MSPRPIERIVNSLKNQQGETRSPSGGGAALRGQYRGGAMWLSFSWAGRNGHDQSPLEKPPMALEQQIYTARGGAGGSTK